MSAERFPQDPALPLSPGAWLGPWQVVERHGYGGYGIVYRALHFGRESSGPVALKLARYPWDRRFEREAELLSRIYHSSIPRLFDKGVWRLPSGAEHSYLVMEWVAGTPFYEWGATEEASPEQQLRLVAQLAGALAVIHAAGALHRDVKGDNVRVRHLDGRAVLMDFGSGHFQGSAPLTWGSLPPGTDEYRSPEAWRFLLNAARGREARFEATPADDLYALGVTVHRLVTGQYPPALRPREGAAGVWELTREDLSPGLDRHARMEPLLRAWLVKLLSLSPEERSTARELARSLERAVARSAGPPPVTSVVRASPGDAR
jgi:serine/threonine protein kinase